MYMVERCSEFIDVQQKCAITHIWHHHTPEHWVQTL